MIKQALKLGEIGHCANYVQPVCVTHPSSVWRGLQCYVGALPKPLVSGNNHYFECFKVHVLNVDNLVKFKLHWPMQ